MANLNLFGKSFTDTDPEQQLILIKNARHLRRQRLPEAVRKAPTTRKKTKTKKQKISNKKAFEQLTIEDQIKLLEDKIAEKKENINERT